MRYRHGCTPVSTLLWKLVSFFIIDIFLINKKLSKLQGFIQGEWNWPISCLNDSETQERGLKGVKIQKISWGSMSLDPPPPQKLAHSALVQEIGQYLSQIHECGGYSILNKEYDDDDGIDNTNVLVQYVVQPRKCFNFCLMEEIVFQLFQSVKNVFCMLIM